VIFTGANSTGTPPVVFTPSARFGLWALANSDTDGTTANLASRLDSKGLFSDTTQNGASGDPTGQHFAIFAQSAAIGNALPVDYFVGFEDLKVGGAPLGDRDYQDGVFKLRVVPEPGYYILLSLGLAGLGLRRRMNKTSVN